MWNKTNAEGGGKQKQWLKKKKNKQKIPSSKKKKNTPDWLNDTCGVMFNTDLLELCGCCLIFQASFCAVKGQMPCPQAFVTALYFSYHHLFMTWVKGFALEVMFLFGLNQWLISFNALGYVWFSLMVALLGNLLQEPLTDEPEVSKVFSVVAIGEKGRFPTDFISIIYLSIFIYLFIFMYLFYFK